jgi:hypothetical protein
MKKKKAQTDRLLHQTRFEIHNRGRRQLRFVGRVDGKCAVAFWTLEAGVMWLTHYQVEPQALIKFNRFVNIRCG